MTDSPTLPSYSGGVRYPVNMTPQKAGGLLCKVAARGVGSKKGKLVAKPVKGGGKGKSGLSKSTIKSITTISKK